ncbi:MAG: sugar ABC transporter permease [Trueperaceae bacterium]|jgi:multiple sugar transport system permease protein|nr:sugar ABC transporter permease [Truepera sp.]
MTGRRSNVAAWLMLLPALAVVGGVVGYPFLRTLYLSLFDAPLLGKSRTFLGLANYLQAFSTPEFRAAIWHTLHFTVGSIGIELVLGVAVAIFLNREFFGQRALRALLILPLALPTVVNAVMWRWIYNPEYGALNAALTQLHILPDYRSWLGVPGLAMNMIILADVWKNFTLVSLLVLAALQTIPAELHDAARVDGAGPLQRIRFITLPGIRPALLVALVLRTVEALKVFDIIYVMTGGGPASSTKTLSFMVYQEAFSFLKLGTAAAQAFITVALIMVFVGIYIRLLQSRGVAG